MSAAVRNRIAPQMVEYDQVGEQFLPYLMRFHRADCRLPSVSTDEHGMRSCLAADGKQRITYREFMERGQSGAPTGAILGASAAFGVGATHDRHALHNILNRGGARTWYNFGGRAYNSTQEALLFLLHQPMVQEVVVLSGVNNLTLSALAPRTSPIFNSFFSQRAIEQGLQSGQAGAVGVRRAAKLLLHELALRFGIREQTTATVVSGDPGERYRDTLACFRRDLRLIKAITVDMGGRLTYVLQPIATWIDKTLSPEEVEIFASLDRQSGDWRILAEQIATHKDRYRDDVAAICADLGVPFVDTNRIDGFRSSTWLFVDRVHLTDAGYALLADALTSHANRHSP